jgi:hypothetical protein
MSRDDTLRDALNTDGARGAASAKGSPMTPPPAPLDREAVARALMGLPISWEEALRYGDAVLALMRAAPPPVPEDVPRWRVGRRVPVNVYRDDVVAAQFQHADWAAEAVAALNNAIAPPEARLAQTRAAVLEEAAKVCDWWAAFCEDQGDTTRALWFGRKQYAERCAQHIRALAGEAL